MLVFVNMHQHVVTKMLNFCQDHLLFVLTQETICYNNNCNDLLGHYDKELIIISSVICIQYLMIELHVVFPHYNKSGGEEGGRGGGGRGGLWPPLLYLLNNTYYIVHTYNNISYRYTHSQVNSIGEFS